MALTKGQPAPDFELDGIGADGQPGRFSLAQYRGHPVVLAFYPGDDTPVCTKQLNAYTSEIGAFAEVDAQVLGISPQDVESKQAFYEKQGGFAFPLLADTDKAVGAAYGVLGPVGFYRRSVVVLDAEGTVVWVHRAIAGLTFRPTDELVAAVKGAGRS